VDWGREIMAIDITKIPGIMRFHGWNGGASLMESWQRRSASTAPSYSTPNMMVTMDSVLKFKRAKDVYDKAVSEQVWVNAAAKAQLVSRLRARGIFGSKCAMFGDLSQPASVVDANYVNFRAVDTGTTLDDLTATLGNFTFHFAVECEVDMKPASVAGKVHIEVTKAGIYIVDSFDFNDLPNEDQFLGYWDAGDNSVSYLNPFSGDSVHNSDFRKWRAATNMGGDFMVYSDIKVIPISPALVFEA